MISFIEESLYKSKLTEQTAQYPLVNDCIATKQAIDQLKLEIEINTKKALSEKNGWIYTNTAKAQKAVLQNHIENFDLIRCNNLFSTQKTNELSALITEESKEYETEVSAQTSDAKKWVLYIGGGAIAVGFIIILSRK